MNVKKTALASAVALALSGSVWAVTSTVDGAFILDKTTVMGGDVINLALLGLNKDGEVDLLGEERGAVIIATVKSEIGRVVGGDTDPGEQPSEDVAGGNFAADVKYVRLTQGTGRVHIRYPDDTIGTDTVQVILQERTANSAGGVQFTEIARTTKTITVTQAQSSNPMSLDIVAFKPAPADSRGKVDCIGYGGRSELCKMVDDDGVVTPPEPYPNNGIWGAMTAGAEGGQIIVEAGNRIAVGNVTVNLRRKVEEKLNQCPPPDEEVSDVPPYTARMQRGEAIIPLDNQLTKAGTYFIEATFTDLEGNAFEGNSVDLFYADTVTVHGTGLPSGLKLCSDKTVVAKAEPNASGNFPTGQQVAQGTKIKAVVVDEFGNVTSNNTNAAIRVGVTDANGVFSNTALNLTIPVNATTTMGIDESGLGTDSIVGNAPNEIIKLGLTSLVAAATESAAPITPSDSLQINVVPDSLLATPVGDHPELGVRAFDTSQLAGTEFDAFSVYITNGLGQVKITPGNPIAPELVNASVLPHDPGPVTITSSRGEEIQVNRKNDTPHHVQALFEKAVDEGTYLIGDAAGNFGQVLVTVLETDPIRLARGITEAGILPAAATVVRLENGHGTEVTEVSPGPLTEQKQFVTAIAEASFKMFDSFGNAVTGKQPLTEDDTGTVTVDSANDILGASPIYSAGGSYGIPGRVNLDGTSETINVIYPTEGEAPFAGEDTIQVTFTKPGLGVDGLSIKTQIPKPHTDAFINSYIETTNVPINSVVPLAVELTDETGSPFSGATPAMVTLEVNTDTSEFVDDLDIVTPAVSKVRWVEEDQRVTEATCKGLGGIFDKAMTTIIPPSTVVGPCWTVEEIPVTSGSSLQFTQPDMRFTPPSSKIFAVNVGPSVGQFSLTFYNTGDATSEGKETRFFKVGKKVVPPTPPTEEECLTDGGVWNAETEECTTVPDIGTPDGGSGSVAVGPDGQPVESNAVIKGGVGINGADLVTNGTMSMSGDMPADMIFAATIKFDEADIGETVDVIVAVIYDIAFPLSAFGPIYYDFKDEALDLWDGDVAALDAYKAEHEIVEGELYFHLPLWTAPPQAQFEAKDFAAGAINVHVGYRMGDGTIKYSGAPIRLDILP